MAYIHLRLPSKKFKLKKSYKTIEVLAIDVKFNNTHDIISWAISKHSTIVLLRDLNLDRLRPNEKEGKLLIDLEEIHQLICLITEATRVITTSSTPLDVILTNNSDLFKFSGVSELRLSDHQIVYTFLRQSVKQHEAKIITCRSIKNLNLDEFKQD